MPDPERDPERNETSKGEENPNGAKWRANRTMLKMESVAPKIVVDPQLGRTIKYDEFTGTIGAHPEAIEGTKPAPEITAELASALHDEWRETQRQEDGTFTPRVETTIDQAWITSHGTNQVDVADTEFADLPSDWQVENAAAAKVVTDYLAQKGLYDEKVSYGKGGDIDFHYKSGLDFSDPAVRAEAGQIIHNAWLKRKNNADARGGELDVPFDQLPQDEQDKDLRQVELALQQEAARRIPDRRDRYSMTTYDTLKHQKDVLRGAPESDYSTRFSYGDIFINSAHKADTMRQRAEQLAAQQDKARVAKLETTLRGRLALKVQGYKREEVYDLNNSSPSVSKYTTAYVKQEKSKRQ